MRAHPRISRKAIGVFVLTAIFAVAVSFQYLAPNSLKRTLISEGVTQYFVHTYHSLRKLPDIAFFPYWFRNTSLPVYNLIIDEKDIKKLDAALPQDPIKGHLGTSNRLLVKGTFLGDSYQGVVEVRYHGTNANHWNSQKRSWRINFLGASIPSKDNLFERMAGLNLIIPGDRDYYADNINAYRAKKLGLSAPDIKLVRLRVNMRDYGVYLASEAWTTEWVEKNALPTNGNLLAIDDTQPGFGDISAFSSAGAYLWKSYTQNTKKGKTAPAEYPEIQTLTDLIAQADEQTFAALIPHLVDMDKVYAWDIVSILANSTHQNDKNNAVLFFNTATGKFEPIAWDVGFTTDTKHTLYTEDRALEKRILAIPRFRAERDARLKNYIEDPRNLADDLKFYDALVAQTRADFLSDNTKLDNNISYLLDTRSLRAAIIRNAADARLVLETSAPQQNALDHHPRTIHFTGSFAHLPEVVYSRETFLSMHPQFFAGAPGEINIAGAYFLPETAVIPAGYTFVIQPGTTLYLGENASLVSYSRVRAQGTAAQPIRILAADDTKPFGSFLVVDTGKAAGDPSRFSWVTVRGGSGTTVNGIITTGMLALHVVGSVEIEHSSFAHSFNDDALNIKYSTMLLRDNTFTDTFADAIDSDVNTGTLEHNTFLPIIGRDPATKHAGDAIDISFSNLTIRNNQVLNATDKCISVGEQSRPTIENNTLEHCDIGVAVKDLSHAIIQGNTIRFNQMGVSLYQKKAIFGGAYAELIGNTIQDNKENILSDKLSQYELK